MPITNVLSGPSVGINGVPGEFVCNLWSVLNVTAYQTPTPDVVTLSSSNGSDTFSATFQGPTVSTVTIPSGSSFVWFYLNAAAGAARNISITDGNGYTVSGSPVSFTPSASLADPTTWSWVPGGTFRPNSLIDPNLILFDSGTDMSGLTPAALYNYGTNAPTVALNSSGMTITAPAGGGDVSVALPLSCYPPVGFAFIELTVGSVNANGGTVQFGPAIIRTDTNYPGSWFSWDLESGTTVQTYGQYYVNSGTNGYTMISSTGWSGTPSNWTTPGTVLTCTFCQSVATLFYRVPAGSDLFAQPLSSSIINASPTGTECTAIVAGTCDQRDTTIAPYLTLGVAFYSGTPGCFSQYHPDSHGSLSGRLDGHAYPGSENIHGRTVHRWKRQCAGHGGILRAGQRREPQ